MCAHGWRSNRMHTEEWHENETTNVYYTCYSSYKYIYIQIVLCCWMLIGARVGLDHEEHTSTVLLWGELSSIWRIIIVQADRIWYLNGGRQLSSKWHRAHRISQKPRKLRYLNNFRFCDYVSCRNSRFRNEMMCSNGTPIRASSHDCMMQQLLSMYKSITVLKRIASRAWVSLSMELSS